MTAHRLRSHVRLMAQMAQAGQLGPPRAGLVTDYDASTFAAKIELQPEGIETGWLQICPAWSGPGWGLFGAPTKGMQVLAVFLEGDVQAGMIIACVPSDEDLPPVGDDGKGPLAGELWAVHSTGSLLKFLNTGDVAVTSNRDLIATVGRDLNATITGKLVASATEFDLTGDLKVTGDINCTKTVTATTDVVGGGKHLKTHTHTSAAPGSPTSAPL